MRCLVLSLAVLAFQSACLVGDVEDDDSVDTSDTTFDAVGDPRMIDIGFDGGTTQLGVDQFAFFPVFFAGDVHPSPRLCHTYVAWNVGDEAPALGNAQSPAGHRAAFEWWLQQAQSVGHCDDVLVSFQAYAVDGQGNPRPGARCPDDTAPPCNGPTAAQMRGAFQNFLAANWAGETGYTGTFSFTPWNEPNNPFGPGNGLGKVIPPELAAHYYLEMASLCAASGCKVAAGDFASNGNWPKDFEWNCANDNIANLTTTHADGQRYCRHASSLNPGNHLPASYLDRYKNYIALHSDEYSGLTSRPKYFAFHAWHDVNEYLDHGAHCTSYDNCVTRRVIKSLSGSWAGVLLWDTEVGASQGADVSDDAQACDAAFLVRLTALDARIKRLYYTRLYNGGNRHGGELIQGNNPATATGRPALGVLALRERQYAGASCR